MPVLAYYIIAGGGAALMGGFGIRMAGEGIDDASNGAVKLAGAGALAFGLFKIAEKQGWL